MKYLLDTNICVFFFRNKFGVREQMRRVGLDNCAISILTVAELLVGFEYTLQKTGIDKREELNRFINRLTVIPIDSAIEFSAKERARLELEGKPMRDMVDAIIASTSVVNDMVMVTENVRHFNNIQGVKMENWVNRDIS